MTLDAKDKTTMMGLRMTGSAKVADLIESMDAKYGELPSMKKVNETFTGLATAQPSKLKELNAVLEKNPGLAAKIQDNLGRDPEGFRTKFLPAVFENPESAVALVGQKPQTAAAPVKTGEYGYEPIGVLAPKKTDIDAAPSTPAQTTASPASTTAPATAKQELGKTSVADARLAAKMQLLVATPGYDELMARVQKSQPLTDAVTAMMAGNGSLEEREEAIDAVLQKTKENPNLFKNLSKNLDEYPGAANSIASTIASDPKNALNTMAKLGSDEGPAAGIMGMFGGGAGGLSGMLSGLFGGMNGGIMGLITAFVGMITQLFSSGNHLLVASNVGTAQYNDAIKATDAKPDSVTVIDASGQSSGAVPVASIAQQNQTQEKQKAAAVAGPQQTA